MIGCADSSKSIPHPFQLHSLRKPKGRPGKPAQAYFTIHLFVSQVYRHNDYGGRNKNDHFQDSENRTALKHFGTFWPMEERRDFWYDILGAEKNGYKESSSFSASGFRNPGALFLPRYDGGGACVSSRSGFAEKMNRMIPDIPCYRSPADVFFRRFLNF